MITTVNYTTINELRKLNGFKDISASTLINICKSIYNHLSINNILTKQQYIEYIYSIKSLFSIVSTDDELPKQMSAYCVLSFFESKKMQDGTIKMVPRPLDVVMAFVTHAEQFPQYKKLWEKQDDNDFLTKMFINSVKQQYLRYYDIVYPTYKYTKEDLEKFTYDDCVNLNERMSKDNISKRAVPVGEAHRPEEKKCIYKIDFKTNKVVKTYDTRKECCDNEGMNKSMLSQLLSGKRKKYKGYKYSHKSIVF